MFLIRIPVNDQAIQRSLGEDSRSEQLNKPMINKQHGLGEAASMS